MSIPEQLQKMESFFGALADKTRLRLINLMREDEICVCFFTEVLGESQPKISRHLAYLRKSGLVEARKDGKWMHYSLVEPEDPDQAYILKDVLEWLWSQPGMQVEYRDLEKVCCALDAPVTIARAPKPEKLVEPELGEPVEEQLETYLL